MSSTEKGGEAASSISSAPALLPASASPAASRPSSGPAASRPSVPELVDGDVGPMPPVAMLELEDSINNGEGGQNSKAGKKRFDGVEQIEDDQRPLDHETAALAYDDSASKEKAKIDANRKELVLGDGPRTLLPPSPFNPALLTNSDAQINMKQAPAPGADGAGLPSAGRSEDEGAAPVVGDIEAEGALSSEGTLRNTTIDLENDISTDGRLGGNGISAEATQQQTAQTHFRQQRISSTIPTITEAYPVDYGSVIIATPTEPERPWWKRKRALCFFLFTFVALALLSIALGLISSMEKETDIIHRTFSPSISAVPTLQPTTGRPSALPTMYPSMSQLPSISPTACGRTVAANVQLLDILRPYATNPKMAIDGQNLVVVSRDARSPFSFDAEGSFYIVFYALEVNGDAARWEPSGYFIEGDVDWRHDSFIGEYDVSISGRTALIGLPSTDLVYAFQRTKYGLWAKVESPKPEKVGPGPLGHSVSIAGDLAVITDFGVDLGLEPSSVNDASAAAVVRQGTYVMRINRGRWEQVATMSSEGCTCLAFKKVAADGNTIAVLSTKPHGIDLYQYRAQDGKLTAEEPLRSERAIRTFVLRGDHLVFSTEAYRDDDDDDLVMDRVFVYNRSGANQPFALLQSFNSSDYDDGFGQALALDKGLLVVGSRGHTHIFSYGGNGDLWEEILTLEQSYTNYELSGRKLFAANEMNVSSMDIADCTQPIPTQTPSVSASPTICHPVEISFRHDANETGLWEATIRTSELLESDSDTIKLYTDPADCDDDINTNSTTCVGFDDSACLRPGRYRFKFLAESYHGQYSVTSNRGAIAKEDYRARPGENVNEEVVFDIPFLDPTNATSSK